MQRFLVLGLAALLCSSCASTGSKKPAAPAAPGTAAAPAAATAPATEAKAKPSVLPEKFTASDVFKRYQEVTGGPLYKQLKTCKITGVTEEVGSGRRGAFTAVSQTPGKFNFSHRVDGLGEFVYGWDGFVGWQDDAFLGPRQVTPAAAQVSRLFGNPWFLLEWRRNLDNIKIIEAQAILKANCVGISARLSGAKNYVRLYFDVASGVLVNVDVLRDDEFSPALVSLYFDSYQEVNGLKFATVIGEDVWKGNIETVTRFSVTKVEVNGELERDAFKAPPLK